LKLLSAEKLVISEPYKGSIVAEISIEEAFEIYQLHAILVGSAAFLATDKITESQLDMLASLIEESKKLDPQDFKSWVTNNRKIHRLVIKACDNKRLIDLIKTNNKLMNHWVVAPLIRDDFNRRNKEHEFILEKLREKDAIKVRQAFESHIMAASKDLWKKLEQGMPIPCRDGIELPQSASF